MSNWDSDAAKRRDIRRSMVPSDVPRARSSKDTKRWCRGKEGVEHQPKCVTYYQSKNLREPDAAKGEFSISMKWRTLLCAACGRHLAYYWPFNDHDAPPPWVDK